MTETVPQGALLLDVSESREIAEDWQVPQGVMAALPFDSSPATLAGAWILEKAGRLKLNGRLSGYSPLSRLVELEGLWVGVEGKLSMLLARAEEQLRRLDDHRGPAAREALAA